MIGLNGYTVCSGIIDRNLNGKDIIAVPLAEESDMRIGYITNRRCLLSRLGTTYLEALKQYVDAGQEDRSAEHRGRFYELDRGHSFKL